MIGPIWLVLQTQEVDLRRQYHLTDHCPDLLPANQFTAIGQEQEKCRDSIETVVMSRLVLFGATKWLT